MPFSPVIAQYISIAMTHVDEQIRIQSLDFLDVWLRFFPSLAGTAGDVVISIKN